MTHTSTGQPETLRLAFILRRNANFDAIRKGRPAEYGVEYAAADMILSLHARVQELEEIERQLCEQADVAANAYRELQASQAQREPLTEDELFQALFSLSVSPPKRIPSGWIEFARSIEAAHGITQEKQV